MQQLISPRLFSLLQIDLLCEFLSSTHLLRHLQPTNIRDLAQTMAGKSCTDGELIYTQHDTAKHFYVVLAGEVVMYEADSSGSNSKSGQQQGNPQSQNQHHASSGLSPHGTKPWAGTAVNNGKHSPPHTPRTPRSAAAASGASNNHSSASATPRSQGGAAGSSVPGPDMMEVRRVGPREAFGEDEVTAGCTRQQSAVAAGANSSTWAAATSNTGATAASGSMAGMASSTPASAGSAAAGVAVGGSAAGGSTDSSNVRGFLNARRRSMARTTGGGMFLDSGVVVLQLSADDYGAVLEGRLSAMMEEKVRSSCDLLFAWPIYRQ